MTNIYCKKKNIKNTKTIKVIKTMFLKKIINCLKVYKNILINYISSKLDNNEVFFITSNDLLPEPLTKEEEELLIKQFETTCDEKYKNELIEKNLRLVVYISKKFENTGINIEDIISIGTIGLIKAISTFKSDKNIKLATYASRCIENEILMYIRKSNKYKNDISLDMPLNTDWDGNELLLSDTLSYTEDNTFKDIDKETDSKILSRLINKLNPREKEIVTLRFGLNNSNTELTQKEVADYLGISQSYISRLEKRIMKRMKKELVKLY